MGIQRAVLLIADIGGYTKLHALEPQAPGPRAVDGGTVAGVRHRRCQGHEVGEAGGRRRVFLGTRGQHQCPGMRPAPADAPEVPHAARADQKRPSLRL
ncbi:hypothetical protein I108_02053 [Mycobacterium tuberculosis OFXR-5]|nr:hypothetical protein Q642_02681 [Mycobacterium tuberculosis OFXR-33]KBX55256.1 hypothetical protein I108_02053 [Mycobacterium tuberculosis OFXR-5]